MRCTSYPLFVAAITLLAPFPASAESVVQQENGGLVAPFGDPQLIQGVRPNLGQTLEVPVETQPFSADEYILAEQDPTSRKCCVCLQGSTAPDDRAANEKKCLEQLAEEGCVRQVRRQAVVPFLQGKLDPEQELALAVIASRQFQSQIVQVDDSGNCENFPEAAKGAMDGFSSQTCDSILFLHAGHSSPACLQKYREIGLAAQKTGRPVEVKTFGCSTFANAQVTLEQLNALCSELSAASRPEGPSLPMLKISGAQSYNFYGNPTPATASFSFPGDCEGIDAINQSVKQGVGKPLDVMTAVAQDLPSYVELIGSFCTTPTTYYGTQPNSGNGAAITTTLYGTETATLYCCFSSQPTPPGTVVGGVWSDTPCGQLPCDRFESQSCYHESSLGFHNACYVNNNPNTTKSVKCENGKFVVR